MKQNNKKISIYSENLNNCVNSFEDFLKVKSELFEFSFSLKNDLTVGSFFKSKSVSILEKVNLFESALASSMHETLFEILKVVIENNDIHLINQIDKHFTLLSKEKLNIAFVEITSSQKLETSLMEDIKSSLSEIINKKVKIEFFVDNKLLGGLKIKVDDVLYDNSLLTKLENAKSKLIGV
jgi:F-type H+-transporting ATPase subunit delta